MKPNFALTLSFEGISLLHRAFPGWHMVGEVNLDNSDLPGALSDLRHRAEQLDSNPIRSKLVIPNDQIRFLQFDSEGLEADEIASAVHRALNGATPYAVDDLAYDWSISAGQVHVAAVARETLAEAEAFAAEHGFNPLCFVAVPESRDFVGEPWFGEAAGAAALLPEGGRIDRDTAAIRVIGTAPLHAAPVAAPAAGAAAPEAALEGAPEPATPEVPSTPEPDLPPGPQPEVPPSPEPDLPPQPEPEVPPTPGTPPAPDPEIEPEIQPDPEPVPEVPPTPQPDIPPEPTPQPEPDIPPNPTPGPAAESAQADDVLADKSPDLPPTPEAGAGDPAETPAAPVAFSSIRARRDTLPAAPRRLAGATRDSAEAPAHETPRTEPALTAAPPLTSAADAESAAKVTGTPQDALPPEAAARIGATLRPSEDIPLTPPDPDLSADDALSARPDADIDDEDGDIPPPPAFMADRIDPAPFDLPEDTPNAPLAAPAGAKAPSAAAPAGALSFISRRKAARSDKRQATHATPRPSPEAEREQERQRMTVFGARKPASVGGKPRFLGLILTAVLLIFLVGVAAWASIFLEDGIARVLRDGPAPDTEQIAATPDAEVPPADTAGTSAPRTGEADEGESVLAALPGVTSDGAEAPRADAQPQPNPAELTDQQARTRYAVTGIWQRAPDAPTDPGTQTLDDFYLTSIDPKVVEQDAVALPAPDSLRGDTRPDTPADPAAADTMFTMDTRGFVQPTPEGALTPDGVLVYAGQPALVPPSRPAETLAQPGEDPAEAAARIEALERIAALRPRVRPGDLSETNQRETLGGRTRDELAALRPNLRPKSAQELAEEAAAADTATSEAVSTDPDSVNAALEAAAAVPAPDPFAGATAQAVKVSVKPNARPGNFNRIVQRSQRLAEQQEARTAAVAVPRNQRISPSGPTPTTVARAATEKNALRMRRVNLIGVYGTTSNRRALVRLANGSYKKVKVGDRLDGGRVAAIGTSELRYVKSGRSVTLTMPRG